MGMDQEEREDSAIPRTDDRNDELPESPVPDPEKEHPQPQDDPQAD
jgi:hypothetical protein